MSTIQTSLMERRKKNLGGLKSTIQNLSILNKQAQFSKPIQSFPKPSKSSNDIEEHGDDLSKGFNSFLKNFPLMQGNNSKQASNHDQDESLRAFDQNFNTLEILGEGAHGVVKKCVHKITGNLFAVKILQMEDEHFHFLKMNFINIKQLKHDSVIKYKALYLNSKLRKCHLVMEYLPFSHLKKGLTEEELKLVFYKLLDSLEYIHKNNICHRDIKPQNILYDKENKIFKIIDFGVSKNMKLRGRYQEMLTKTGTLYYKAPEMFYGGGYTEKVDSWAAGVTLYEMIVGVTPFASEYLGQTIENILHKEVDFNHENFDNYDPIVKSLIKRLLNRNPKQRLSSQQAKKHLWFNANLQDISLLRSANYQLQKNKSQEKQPNGHSITRKTSLTETKKLQFDPVSKADKKVMKKWLQMMNDSTNTIQEEISIDFVQSQGEEQMDNYPKMTISSVYPNEIIKEQLDFVQIRRNVKSNVEA